ncbi:hypothetical protein EMCRGX_G028448 [Ephydatia muelleri]
MLIMASHLAKALTYGCVAERVHGKWGMFLVHISTIGINVGTAIACFIIIGDSIPPILTSYVTLTVSLDVLRTAVMTLMGVLVAFPLCLVKDLNTISHVSTFCVAFYILLVVQLSFTAFPALSDGSLESAVLWRWKGLLTSVPIISVAFSCQTLLLTVYAAEADPSPRKMSPIIDAGILLVTLIYTLGALFGYISYCTTQVKGDVFANMPTTFVVQLTRLGFCLSAATSFPLLVLPSRESINSLLYGQESLFIPRKQFVLTTALIVGSSLLVAILFPKVEVVLTLTGATMVPFLCYVYPPILLLKLSSTSNKKAKILVVVGMLLMVLSVASVFSSTEGGGGKQLPVITGPLNLTPPLNPQGIVPYQVQPVPLALPQRRRNVDRGERHADMSAQRNAVVTKDTSWWQNNANSTVDKKRHRLLP